ncbi:hypothetical protein AHAS_Ahas05G0145300 [Arachis hypogaea]
MQKVIMLVMKLKEKLMRLNVMRCDNNKNQSFQHLALEMENNSRDYNLFFPSAPTPRTQPTIKSVLQSKEVVEKCDIAIARWMIDDFMLFNAVNSAYYQAMIDVIANKPLIYMYNNTEFIQVS